MEGSNKRDQDLVDDKALCKYLKTLRNRCESDYHVQMHGKMSFDKFLLLMQDRSSKNIPLDKSIDSEYRILPVESNNAYKVLNARENKFFYVSCDAQCVMAFTHQTSKYNQFFRKTKYGVFTVTVSSWFSSSEYAKLCFFKESDNQTEKVNFECAGVIFLEYLGREATLKLFSVEIDLDDIKVSYKRIVEECDRDAVQKVCHHAKEKCIANSKSKGVQTFKKRYFCDAPDPKYMLEKNPDEDEYLSDDVGP